MSGADEYWNKAPIKPQKPNALKILQNDTGYPLLPSVDVDDINPANARCMLKEYIEMAWGMCQNPKSLSFKR